MQATVRELRQLELDPLRHSQPMYMCIAEQRTDIIYAALTIIERCNSHFISKLFESVREKYVCELQ